MATTVEQEASAAKENGNASGQLDVLEQLLKPEVQDSLVVLVDQLPKLAEMVTLLARVYDTVQSIATDEVLINDFKEGFNEFLTPVQDKVKHYASMAIEANDRAQTNTNEIGLFGLLRMLKNPEMQKLFRFAQAYLDIMSARKNES